MIESPARRTDRLLIAEGGLTLLLVGLGVYLYMRPAAQGLQSTEWWHWMLLGLLFFGIVALHMARKRRESRRVLHEVIREDAEGRASPR